MTSSDPDPPLAARRLAAAESFYTPLVAAQTAARRVGWETDGAHLLRLRAILEAVAPLARLTSLLDAGCGEGRLLPLLRERGFAGRYEGRDILPHMVEAARHLHGRDPLARFVAEDVFTVPGQATFDAVVCSGALNPAVSDRDGTEETIAALDALWSCARDVLAVDFIVADRRPPTARLARIDAPRVWRHARNLTPLVTLREDVVPGEALLVLRRTREPVLRGLLPEDDFTLARAEVLLAGAEPDAVIRALGDPDDPEARLYVALAHLQARRLGRAEALLRGLDGTPAERDARLHLASVLWLTGRRQASEALLRDLAADWDEARFHLIELLAGRGEVAEAQALADQLEDPWVQREAARMIALARLMPR